MEQAEVVAAYVGLLRHELHLPRGADALLDLELRLTPADARQRPPARAPGIARLARALKRLRAHKPPAVSLEVFAEDLRFLRAFDDDPAAWSSEALDDLLANVIASPAARTPRSPAKDDAGAKSPPPVPFRPRKPRGDA